MSDVHMLARIRQLLQGIDQAAQGNPEEPVTMNEQLELLVALGASPYGEIVKIGRAFEVHTTAAVAAVVAIPSIANMLSIWNGEPDGGRSLIIDRVWGLRIASTTAIASQASLIGCLGQTRVASLASLALVINALNGNGGKDTKVINSNTNLDAVTGVAGNWRSLPGQTGGLKISAGAATVGGDFVNADVNGRIIVPPGRMFAIHVFAPLVAETFIAGIEWHERYIRLG